MSEDMPPSRYKVGEYVPVDNVGQSYYYLYCQVSLPDGRRMYAMSLDGSYPYLRGHHFSIYRIVIDRRGWRYGYRVERILHRGVWSRAEVDYDEVMRHIPLEEVATLVSSPNEAVKEAALARFAGCGKGTDA